jgi:hypothetical protein
MVRKFNPSACKLEPVLWELLEQALAGKPLLGGVTTLED